MPCDDLLEQWFSKTFFHTASLTTSEIPNASCPSYKELCDEIITVPLNAATIVVALTMMQSERDFGLYTFVSGPKRDLQTRRKLRHFKRL